MLSEMKSLALLRRALHLIEDGQYANDKEFATRLGKILPAFHGCD